MKHCKDSLNYSQISAFDLDGTLLLGTSSYLFFVFLIRSKVFSLRALIPVAFYLFRHRFCEMSLVKLHTLVFRKFLFGKKIAHITKNLDAFLEHSLDFHPPVLERLRRAQHLGHYTVILSNSPQFLIEPISKMLGVNEWRGTEYKIDRFGCFSDVVAVLDGNAKAQYLESIAKKLNVEKTGVTVYSDSYLDLSFLRSGTPIVVKPDARLKKISKAQGWEEIL